MAHAGRRTPHVLVLAHHATTDPEIVKHRGTLFLQQINTPGVTTAMKVCDNRGMHVSARNEFVASPAEVEALFLTPAFLQELVRAGRPVDSQIHTADRFSEVSCTQGLPSAIHKFAGSTVTFITRATWANTEHGRQCEIDVHVPGQPVNIHGMATALPNGDSTIVDFDGAVTINMPIIGKKMEKEVAPFVTQIFAATQRHGDAWIAQQHQ